MQNRDGISWEISVGVTFASFMSAVALFFTGILIAQYQSFDSTIKIPLLYLIISTFSFIFSASIYSNAGVEVTKNKPVLVRKYLIYANNILEFLGLYLFILATPMVIGAITHDNFLRFASIIIAIVSIALYSQSGFSVLARETNSRREKAAITIFIVLLMLALYFSQKLSQVGSILGYSQIATVLLLFIIGITIYFCLHSKQYK